MAVTVAAEPYPFAFDPARAALLIIDMQRDFLEPGGFGAVLGNDVSLLRSAIAPTRGLLDAARGLGMLVIHTREGHRPDLADLPPSKKARGRLPTGIGDGGPMGRILIRGESGHDIIPELAPLAGEPVIDKPGHGAFNATDLDAILRNRGIEQLVVCGVTTEVRVNTSVREANDRGYECLVMTDATGSYFPEFHAAALRILPTLGIALPLRNLYYTWLAWRLAKKEGRDDVTAVPLGIYNFPECMNDVESAAAAGDDYDMRRILIADGVGAIGGALLGSPFPPAVCIGHPGWKAAGGRLGYSLATGVVCFLGLTALLLALIPLVAILPILLSIGLVIGAQAFQATLSRHAPAIVLAILPNLAAWAQTQVDGALNAAGTSAEQVGYAKLGATGVVYHGMALLGGGAVLAGMMLGAIAACVIDRRFQRAAIYAAAGAILSYFGFIHGTSLGIGASAPVAFGYVPIATICLLLSRPKHATSITVVEPGVVET